MLGGENASKTTLDKRGPTCCALFPWETRANIFPERTPSTDLGNVPKASLLNQ